MHFLYTDQLPYGLEPPQLKEVRMVDELNDCISRSFTDAPMQLADAGRALQLPDLVEASQKKVKARAVADSAAVERQMRPALTDPAISSLRCVCVCVCVPVSVICSSSLCVC